MDWVKKVRISFFRVLACSALILLQSNASPSQRQAHDAGPPQVANDPKLDSTLAEYYEIYASVVTFEDRIGQFQAAHEGLKPAQIEVTKSTEEGFVQHLPSSAIAPTSSPLLESEVANSDLVVMGVPVASRTLPIQDHTFLFTEYDVRVNRVISTNRQNILPGDTITISRAGGELSVNGVLIKAIEPAFDQFHLNQKYIFFLRAIPRTDTYRALGSGTFSVESNSVTSVSHFEASREPKRDLDGFLSEVNTAVAHKRAGKN